MKKKKNIRSICSGWLFAFSLIVQSGFSQSAFQSLIIPVSAQQMALTGGSSSVTSVIPRFNPASLHADGMWLCLNYISFPADITGHHLQMVTPLRAGIFGLSLTNIDYGTLEDSYTLHKFTARDLLVRTTWKSTIANTLSYGFGLGLIHSKIESYSASGLVLNMGVRGRMLKGRLGLGLSLENAGLILSDYDNTGETLPTAFRAGMNFQPMHLPAVLAVDAVKYADEDLHLIASIELSTSDKFTLRVSTSSYKEDLQIGDYNEEFISGMAGGLAMKFTRFTVDIGMQDLGAAGIITAFGLNYEIRKNP